MYKAKGFSLVNEKEVDFFLEFSSFFYDPSDVDNLISVSSAFSKSSLYIWQFSVHILLKPHLEDFEYYYTVLWNECMVVWAFFGIALLWDCNENWPFHQSAIGIHICPLSWTPLPSPIIPQPSRLLQTTSFKSLNYTANNPCYLFYIWKQR